MCSAKLNYNNKCVNKKKRNGLWILENAANPLDFITSLSMSMEIFIHHLSDKFLISAVIMLFCNCNLNIISKIFKQL